MYINLGYLRTICIYASNDLLIIADFMFENKIGKVIYNKNLTTEKQQIECPEISRYLTFQYLKNFNQIDYYFSDY